MEIISLVQIEGKWVSQGDADRELADKAVEEAMNRASAAIGAKVKKDIKRRRAGNKMPPAV